MANRAQCKAVANDYVTAFNEYDIEYIESLFEDEVVVSRQDEPQVNVGVNAVAKRVKKYWVTSIENDVPITAVCGLIDFKDTRAMPCVAILAENTPLSVVVCEAEKGKKAHLHTELTDTSVVSSVRFCCAHKQMRYEDDKTCPQTCEKLLC
ncbi:hypothetical protein [Terasakiella sp. SH-1]|uniref:hypothetical protein n=1 Tax=Terasakiella sp. SH-1 TaxID=2560057 RepID=UPI00107483C8|nr:hypothetical protein [Terasakiella sp. SH-1]